MSSDARARRTSARPRVADRGGRHGSDGRDSRLPCEGCEPLGDRGDAVDAGQHDPVVAAQASTASSSARTFRGPDLDERHERHLGAETLELLGERLRLRSRDDDASSVERLVINERPPVCGLRREQAPLARVARRLRSVSLPGHANHSTSIDRGNEALETNRGVVVVTARAATGAAQPPPSVRRKARSAVVSARAAGRRSPRGARARRRRPCGTGWRAPPVPAQGASSLPQPLGDDLLEAEPPDPAAASTVASYSPSETLRIRVSTFPRIERISRSGRNAASCADRLRLLVPTTAPAGNSASEPAVRATRQSRTSSRQSRRRSRRRAHPPSGGP